jgi:hypothetical protein
VNVQRESLRENILAAQVEAAMRGHELGAFEAVDEPGRAKYQVFCRSCGKSVYVSDAAVYSILEDECPAEEKASLWDPGSGSRSLGLRISYRPGLKAPKD